MGNLETCCSAVARPLLGPCHVFELQCGPKNCRHDAYPVRKHGHASLVGETKSVRVGLASIFEIAMPVVKFAAMSIHPIVRWTIVVVVGVI